MRSIIFPFFLFTGSIVFAGTYSLPPAASPIEGRWDVTINIGGKESPSWFEVIKSGNHTLIGQFVALGGSARPISKVNFSDNKVNFSIPPQWESGDKDLTFEATLQGDILTGTITFPDGKSYSCTANRAPSLLLKSAATWGTPVHLFNGKDLKGWHASGENQWIVKDGILTSPKPGSNMITDAIFTNFKLHIEFRYPKDGNSGVYLRGRYEVQIADNNDEEPQKGRLGAVYGFLPPSEMVAKKAGEWQYYDITIAGRMVTVVANGKTIICNQEIPGITGGALDSKEAEPGPLMLQGDHEPIEYRNIILTPAK